MAELKQVCRFQTRRVWSFVHKMLKLEPRWHQTNHHKNIFCQRIALFCLMTSILHGVPRSVTSEAFSPHLVQVSALLSSLWMQTPFQTHSTMAPQAPWTYYLHWLAASTLLKAIVTQQKVIWKSSKCIIIVLTAGTTMFVSLLNLD